MGSTRSKAPANIWLWARSRSIHIHSRRGGTLLLIMALYCVYAGLYIHRTSFLVEGQRFFSLFDDAMVSMRYAQNLANGDGLVWNSGERIEGFTNLLWTLYMTLLHLLSLPSSKISLLVQISGAAFLGINLVFVKRIAESLDSGNRLATFAPVVLTAFYLPLNTWGLQGMEVSVLTLILSAALWHGLRALTSEHSPLPLYLLLGLATLVRVDLVATFVAILLFMVFLLPRDRKTHLLTGLAVLTSCVVIQTMFRWLYYGDVFPNTYYLKMTGYPLGLRIARGFLVFADFAGAMTWFLFVFSFVAILLRRERRVLLLAWVFLVQAAYSIYVGGDAWEWWGGSNRYVTVAMPALFILFGASLGDLRAWLESQARRMGPWLARFARYAALVVFLLSMHSFNRINDQTAIGEWILMQRPLHVADNQYMVKMSRVLTEITTADARIAVVWAGAGPYFSGRPCVDLLGKNDPVIARMPMRSAGGESRWRFFYPGHLKWDYGHSIGALEPDVVSDLVGDAAEAEPYLEEHYQELTVSGFRFYVRRGSDQVLWEKLGS